MARCIDRFLSESFQSESIVDDLVLSVVSKLRKVGIRTHLATNQETHRTQFLLEEMRLKDIFDQVFSSSRVGHLKPSKDYLDSIIDTLRCGPSSILL